MLESTATTVSTIVGVAFLSWLTVGAIRRYALARGVLDRPNERSSHLAPTPRGGGAGLVASAIIGYLLAAPSGGMSVPIAVALFAVVPTAIAGWIDDRGALPVLPRITAHVASGLLVLPVAIGAELSLTAGVVLGLAWILATVSAINVVNFIDGIDGLVGLQALLFAIHASVLSEPDSPARALGTVLAAASVGFLLWNWAPARVFLGDAGSGSVAVLGLVGGILVWRSGFWPFAAVFLPLFPIFLDASVAILRRIGRGERLTVAHRSHLYQRLANERGWGHARVSILYGAAAASATGVVMASDVRWLPVACLAYVAGVLMLGWLLDRSITATA